LLDLAVQGESYQFVEKCCHTAIEMRWYGDIDPYLISNRRLFLGIITLGLAPALWKDLISFTPPPITEATRRRTQRRERPRGYPDRPQYNKLLAKKLKNSRGNLKLQKLIDDARDQDREELWDETFTPLQRWGCFTSAPIVLFLYNAIITSVVTVAFFVRFLEDRLQINLKLVEAGARPAENTNLELDDVRDSLSGLESYLLVYFFGSLVREMMQMLVEILQQRSVRRGFYFYFTDCWNFFDIMGIITFLVGYNLRHACGALGCLPPPPEPEDHWADWSLMYALCIFCLIFRFLRIMYMSALGQIVSIFLAMMLDFSNFIIFYVVIILGMSVLFVGVADPANLVKQCSDAGVEDGSDLYMSCISAFFFLRTLFQSFGEFFEFDGITNMWSIFFLIFTFFITNILCLNLLIAMMSSTYNDKTAIAVRDRLIEKYGMVEEHARRYIAVPVPFNVITTIQELFAFFFIYYDSVHERYPECSLFERFNLFMSRNRPFSPARWFRSDTQNSHEEHVVTEHEAVDERRFGQTVSAFMERARTAVSDEAQAPDTLLGRVYQISEEVKFVQRMQSNTALEGEGLGFRGLEFHAEQHRPRG
jgi:hypothetical protein